MAFWYFPLMTAEQKAFKKDEILKHPEEWDFRSIPQDQLHIAVRYEYARSSEWVPREFKKWHARRISVPKVSEDFKRWNGKKVAEILDDLLMSDEPLSSEVVSALFEQQPDHFQGSPFADLTDISIHFPRPFLLTARTQINELGHLTGWGRSQSGFQILKAFPIVQRINGKVMRKRVSFTCR